MTNYRRQHQELARLATNAAKWRGHQLGMWSWSRPTGVRVVGRATCADCGLAANVDTWPAPNELHMSGEAMTRGCTSNTARDWGETEGTP